MISKKQMKINKLRGQLSIGLNIEMKLSKEEQDRRKDLESQNVFYDRDYDKLFEESTILGEGCVGQVKKVIRISNGQQFASKMVHTEDEETIGQIINEFLGCQVLDHPNIVKVYELYIDTKRAKVFTIMELINAKQMFSVIHKITSYNEQMASKIFSQIMSGIKYLHDKGICHRDIKPNNILVTEDGLTVKITDFNISKFGKNKKKGLFDQNENLKMMTYTGTVAFTAPEVFQGEYSESVDTWSAGVVLYVMLSGQQPFDSEYVKELITKIQEQELNFDGEIWKNISEDAKQLIIALLQKNPKNRITPSKALIHPFITQKQNTSPLALLAMHNLKSNMTKLLTKFTALKELGVIKHHEKRKTFGIFDYQQQFQNSRGSGSSKKNIESLRHLSGCSQTTLSDDKIMSGHSFKFDSQTLIVNEEENSSNKSENSENINNEKVQSTKKRNSKSRASKFIHQLMQDNKENSIFDSPNKKRSSSLILDNRIVLNETNQMKIQFIESKQKCRKSIKELQMYNKLMGDMLKNNENKSIFTNSKKKTTFIQANRKTSILYEKKKNNLLQNQEKINNKSPQDLDSESESEEIMVREKSKTYQPMQCNDFMMNSSNNNNNIVKNIQDNNQSYNEDDFGDDTSSSSYVMSDADLECQDNVMEASLNDQEECQEEIDENNNNLQQKQNIIENRENNLQQQDQQNNNNNQKDIIAKKVSFEDKKQISQQDLQTNNQQEIIVKKQQLIQELVSQ